MKHVCLYTCTLIVKSLTSFMHSKLNFLLVQTGIHVYAWVNIQGVCWAKTCVYFLLMYVNVYAGE